MEDIVVAKFYCPGVILVCCNYEENARVLLNGVTHAYTISMM